MIEILWHGRGGQGAFTASRLLGAAWCMREGRYGLAFPSFGPERRGAPMCAYTKLSDSEIGDRSAIEKADFVVYLDATLLPDDYEGELKPTGKVLVNSTSSYADDRIVAIDADGISSQVLGRLIPNTAMLAAVQAFCPGLEREDVVEAIHGYMSPRLHEGNIAVVDAVLARIAQQATSKEACNGR